MKLFASLVALATIVATPALAHPTLIPHAHPHDSLQTSLGMDVTVGIGLFVAVAVALFITFSRQR
jgi:hypothetical protein